ncbi:hypothetical protein TDB9533_00450 [Thalassocella blandensis]|nr:hypothetical protein TDB9533_00450 [Thalassocella blandensis]
MSDPISKTVSKVLVYDCDEAHEERVKEFCLSNSLTPVKPKSNKVLEVLLSNVDLGAVFISEDIPGYPGAGIVMGQQIHRYRPELPIFLRVESEYDIPKYRNNVFCATYTTGTIENIRPAIANHVFCNDYPNTFLRSVDEVSRRTLAYFFEEVDISVSTPYLIKDRLIHGEMLSLLPIESEWCKGYLMIQADNTEFLDSVKRDKISLDPESYDSAADDVLSEISNMTWGGIRQRFVAQERSEQAANVQVPVVVNHAHSYISFGSQSPLLSLKYNLMRSNGRSFSLDFMFIFNLHWDPSWFTEHDANVLSSRISGELDFL